MHSFLILSANKNKTSEYVSNFLKEKGIDPLDIDLLIFEKAMGIEDVRNIQKKIGLKPFRGKSKAVVIQAYENITIEAQNALLKVLEEPPASTLIIILSQRIELFLPTIISRCKIIELKEKNTPTADDDISKFNDILNVIFNSAVGAKLKIAQDIAAGKEEDVWLSKMSVFVRGKLLKNYNDPKYSKLLRLLQQTHKNIKSTNVSKRTALENLFLSI